MVEVSSKEGIITEAENRAVVLATGGSHGICMFNLKYM